MWWLLDVLLVAGKHSQLWKNLFFLVASAIDLCREVIGEAAASKLELASPFNNMITRIILLLT